MIHAGNFMRAAAIGCSAAFMAALATVPASAAERWGVTGSGTSANLTDCKNCDREMNVIIECKGAGRPANMMIMGAAANEGRVGAIDPVTIRIDGQTFNINANTMEMGAIGFLPQINLNPTDNLVEAMKSGSSMRVTYKGRTTSIRLSGSRAGFDAFSRQCGWGGGLASAPQQSPTTFVPAQQPQQGPTTFVPQGQPQQPAFVPQGQQPTFVPPAQMPMQQPMMPQGGQPTFVPPTQMPMQQGQMPMQQPMMPQGGQPTFMPPTQMPMQQGQMPMQQPMMPQGGQPTFVPPTQMPMQQGQMPMQQPMMPQGQMPMQPAANDDGTTWFTNSFMDAATGEQQTSLIFGIPETDALVFNAQCKMGPVGRGILTDFIIDTLGQPAGSPVQVSVQSFTNRAQLPGQVFQDSEEYSGIRTEIPLNDPVWNMFKNDDNIALAVIGATQTSQIDAVNKPAVSDFLQACQTKLASGGAGQQPTMPTQQPMAPQGQIGTATQAFTYSCTDGSTLSGRIETAGNTAIAYVTHNGGAEVPLISVASPVGKAYSNGQQTLTVLQGAAQYTNGGAALLCQ